MVAPQILVLLVGVRILLGEIKAGFKSQFFFNGSFEYRFSSSPSQGGETGSTPVGAITNLKKQQAFGAFAKSHFNGFWGDALIHLQKGTQK